MLLDNVQLGSNANWASSRLLVHLVRSENHLHGRVGEKLLRCVLSENKVPRSARVARETGFHERLIARLAVLEMTEPPASRRGVLFRILDHELNVRGRPGNERFFDTKSTSDAVGTEVSGMLGFTVLRMLDIKVDYREGLVDFKFDAKRWQ
jgi:hypothetical protein